MWILTKKKRGAKVCREDKTRSGAKSAAGQRPRAGFAQSEGLRRWASRPLRNVTARSVEQRSAERIRPAAEQTDRRPRRGRRPACAVGGAYPLCAQTFAERDTKKRGAPGCKQVKTGAAQNLRRGQRPQSGFCRVGRLKLFAPSPVRNVTARSVERRAANRSRRERQALTAGSALPLPAVPRSPPLSAAATPLPQGSDPAPAGRR